MAAPTQGTNLIMHGATESELEESANGSVAKGELMSRSFCGHHGGLDKHTPSHGRLVPPRVFGPPQKTCRDPVVYAWDSVLKGVPISKSQNLTDFMSFGTLISNMSSEQKRRLLKAKVAVALQNELGRVPRKRRR